MPSMLSKLAKAARPFEPKLQLGDRVTIPNSPLVWTILTVGSDGFATLIFEDTKLYRFRVHISAMKFATEVKRGFKA